MTKHMTTHERGGDGDPQIRKSDTTITSSGVKKHEVKQQLAE